MIVKFSKFSLKQIIFVFLIIFEVEKCSPVPIESNEFNITIIKYSAKIKKPSGVVLKCSENEVTVPEIASTEVPTPTEIPTITYDIKEDIKLYMDPSADPCDDFYQYACGNFPNVHKTNNSFKLDDLSSFKAQEFMKNLKELLEGDEDEDDNGEGLRKVKTFYKSCMNMEKRNKLGIEPLLKLFDSLGGWPLLNDNKNQQYFNWVRLIAKIAAYNFGIFMWPYVSYNKKSPDKKYVELVSAFGSDFYKDDTAILYKKFIHDTLVLLGVDSEIAQETSEEIFEFSEQLSELHASKSNTSDYSATRGNITFKELLQSVPKINWRQYFYIVYGRNLSPSQIIKVLPKDVIYKLPDFIATAKPTVVKNYIFWKLTEYLLPYLDDRFDDIRKELKAELKKKSQGPHMEVEPWDVMLNILGNFFQGTLLKPFVRKYTKHEEDAEIPEIENSIREAFDNLVQKTDWIDEDAKSEITNKINELNFKVGISSWMMRDDSTMMETQNLDILQDQCFENILNIKRNFMRISWEYQDEFRRPAKNILPLPHALLLYPYFQVDLPKSLVFGIVGQRMAREMISFFNPLDTPTNFQDELEGAWIDSFNETFKEKTECYVDQYDNYEMFDEHIRGNKTEPENIADGEGIRLASYAYDHWLSNNKALKYQQTLPGLDLTPKQLIFLGHAYQMCSSMTPEAAVEFIKDSSYSPPKFRVIGSVSNSHEFAEAYNCPKGSNMNPREKCQIW